MGNELEDRAAIRDVMVRYAHGIDQRDLSVVASAFAPDAHANYGGFDGSGADKITEMLGRAIERFERTMHFMGNQVVEFKDGGADVITYCVAYHVIPRGAPKELLVIGLRYFDEMEPAEGRWAITDRKLDIIWRQTTPL